MSYQDAEAKGGTALHYLTKTLVFVEVKGARVALRTRAARSQGLREARRGRRLRENSAVIGQSVGRLLSRYLELRKEISAGAHAGKGRREAER